MLICCVFVLVGLLLFLFKERCYSCVIFSFMLLVISILAIHTLFGIWVVNRVQTDLLLVFALSLAIFATDIALGVSITVGYSVGLSLFVLLFQSHLLLLNMDFDLLPLNILLLVSVCIAKGVSITVRR